MSALSRIYRSIITLTICLFVMTVTSCSHRVVVRGDSGMVIDDKGAASGGGIHVTPPQNNKDRSTQLLLEEANRWLGTPYKYGGDDANGIDCSALVMLTYKNALGIALPRTSFDQSEWCRKIKKSDLLPGDLLFFRTGQADRVSHVGMYIGDGKMIHASSSRGVIIVDINSKYWTEHFRHCGRVPR